MKRGKRITYRGKYYNYIWSFRNRNDADKKAKRVRRLGYRAIVREITERPGLYGLYTSPTYNTYQHKMSVILD